MLQLIGLAAALIDFIIGPSPAVLQGAVTADTGIEYDSNVKRVPDGGIDMDVPIGSPLLRALASGQLGYSGPRQRLRLQLALGGKVFFLPAAQDQDVGVIQGSYEHGAQIGRTRWSALLDYYDAYQAPADAKYSRDFRSLSAGGRFTGARPFGRQHSIDGGIDLTGVMFMYKPDDSYSFLAPSLTARMNLRLHAGEPDLGHDFDVSLNARADYRGFKYGRTDVFVQSGASVTWQGPLLVQLGYTLQLNLSTKDAESYQRHLVLAKVAVRLPGEFYLTLKGLLNLLQGAPGLFVPVASIDEDNRSLAMLDIERPLPRGFSLSARYTGYFSLPIPDNTLPYQRHTAYLGMTYSFRAQRP